MTQKLTNSPRIDDTIERKKIVYCNLCAHTKHQPHCPENGLGLVKCKNCGLVFVGEQPEPQELYALYGETYFHNDESGVVGYNDYIADEANIRKTVNKRFEIIEEYTDKGRLLDVGCAMGFFIDEAHKRGWEVAGLDVSQFAAEYVKERFGHDAYNGSLLDFDFPEDSFDLVTMYDVIEHVPDPKAYVQAVAKIIKQGGIFELATPDIGSIPARLTGKSWIGYKLSEEHVYYFSVKTLTRLLDEAGFDVVNVRHVGKFVTLNLFLDRLGFYVPVLAKPLQALEKAFGLSKRSFYVNPRDIVAITARKR